jgi:hypothetical protein
VSPPEWVVAASFYPIRAAYSYLLRLHRFGLLERRAAGTQCAYCLFRKGQTTTRLAAQTLLTGAGQVGFDFGNGLRRILSRPLVLFVEPWDLRHCNPVRSAGVTKDLGLDQRVLDSAFFRPASSLPIRSFGKHSRKSNRSDSMIAHRKGAKSYSALASLGNSTLSRPIEYLDFDLSLRRAEGRFVAKVLRAPGGEAEVTFDLPFAETELELFLLKIGQPRRGVRRADTPQYELTRRFGNKLFQAVFKDQVLSSFRSSTEEAARQNRGLRVRLRMNEAPELAPLPWEYLHNASLNEFLALGQDTPVVRYLELERRIPSLLVRAPLRVLMVIASPDGVAQLDSDSEWNRLNTALQPLLSERRVILERLNRATLESLQRRLQGSEVHILHFVGHGGFDAQVQDGFLIFEDERGSQQRVSGRDLSVLLRNHPSVRLAVINACDGARSSNDDPFAGVAQTLVRQGLPAVIAMQFEISDEAAISFAHGFYGALASHYPVDAALVQARTKIYVKSLGVEWGTPVLFMRAPDGRLFDLQDDEPRQSEETPPTPQPQVNRTAARSGWVERQLGNRKQIIAALTLGVGLGVFVYVGTQSSIFKKSETKLSVPPPAVQSVTRIFRFGKLPINLSLQPDQAYNYGFSSLEIDKGLQGQRVRLKRVQINLSFTPRTNLACCDVWILLGPRPFGFTPGAVIKGPNPFFSIHPTPNIAPAQVHFVLGNGGNPLQRGQVVNWVASYDIESGAKSGNIDNLIAAFAPPLILPDGLYAQVFLLNGNGSVNVDVETLSLIVDYLPNSPER